MVKVACQSITFGDKNLNQIDEVMHSVAIAGYEGIEIGFRRLDPAKSEYYAELLNKYNLQLTAIHMGGDFLDPDSVKREMQNLSVAINLAHVLNCKNIFISGKSGLTKKEYETEGRNYNELGKALYNEGIKLCYHNHDWEMQNNAMGLYTLCEVTDPKYMSLVPDIGWITKGGQDPALLITKLFDRIHAVHYKEFTVDGNFIELGKGIVDFKGVYEVMKNKKDYWIVSEQDQSTIGDKNSITQNYMFIKNLIG